MRLRFWGTRGSIATPGPGTNHFGGNTSCVELTTDSGQRFIFDCGTGARPLGAHLMANGPKPVVANILLSHTHWDHIQGFPFFAPLFVPGNKITICGPEGCNKSLPDVLSGQMEYTYFPVELTQLGAKLEYRDMTEGTHEFGDVRITAQYLNHPAVALGYRVEADGVTLLYLCDHEPFNDALWRSDAPPGKIDSMLHAGDRRHAAFMKGGDLVIHDAQYTPEEYPAKKNWGHSPFTYVVEAAAAAGVRKLILTHHDPTHDDAFLAGVEVRARELADQIGSPMDIHCAHEGWDLPVESQDLGERPDLSYAPGVRLEACGLSLLLVDNDEDLRLLAKRALSATGFRVKEASGGVEALQMMKAKSFDLVVLDLNMPAPDGLEVLRILRSDARTAVVPVLVLTGRDDEASTRRSFELGATDFLNKPFTPPQLNARVVACFSHSISH